MLHLIYKPKHFTLQELVDPETYRNINSMILWEKFNPMMLRSLDMIRDIANCPIVINNWHYGGEYKHSGYRPAGCGIGAEFGDHYFFNAFDLKAKVISNKKLYDICLIVAIELGAINVIENINKTPTWCHVGYRPNIKTLTIV